MPEFGEDSWEDYDDDFEDFDEIIDDENDLADEIEHRGYLRVL